MNNHKLNVNCKDNISKYIGMLFLSVFLLIPCSLFAQGTKISISVKDVSLQQLLTEIENKSNIRFSYIDNSLDTKKDITISVKDESIEVLLNRVLPAKGMKYTQTGNTIAIQPASPNNSSSKSKGIPVSGVITDETGNPMPGVNVLVKGTTVGVVTDEKGKYLIDAPDKNAILVFSFIGYTTHEFQVGNQTDFNLVMKEDLRELEEVVVVGYGTVKKSDLTGAVASVSSKDFGDRQVLSVGELLTGKVAGVDVSEGAIRIRGVTTLNNTDPLIIVDGFMGGNYNPNDIEHIEVLKDASSTAIYGARGANGVILITTKSGKKGPLKVNANIYTGIDFLPKKWDVLNASEYVDYATEAISNSNGIVPANLSDPKSRIDVTNWQKEIYKPAKKAEVNLDFSGGTDNAVFSLSLGYNYNETINLGGTTSNNMYARSKNEFKLASWLKGGLNVSINYYSYNSGRTEGADIIRGLPYIPVYNPSNTKGLGYGDSNSSLDGTDAGNPVAYAELFELTGNELAYQPNAWLKVEPVKGLVYHLQAGVNGSYLQRSSWNPDFVMGGGTHNNPSNYTVGYGASFSPLIENYLTYSNVFGKHDFTVLAGNTLQNYVNNNDLVASGGPFADYRVRNLLYATSSQVTQQIYNKYAYLSYFGRINYQFNNRYILTANFRADGSPKFSPSNRWGYFPSVALAWKLHEENWMKELNIFDQLKLRAGWGKSGNDAISDFAYLSKVWNLNVFYPLGVNGDKAKGATVKEGASSDIRWETTTSTTIGLDMAFFKNRLTATVEYFTKTTEDILFTVPVPVSMGYGTNYGEGSPVANAASVDNNGFELLVGYRNNVGGLKYSVNANYTYVQNEVTSLGKGQPYVHERNIGFGNQTFTRTDVGQPIGYYYGFEAEGVFKTQAELDAANTAAKAKGFEYYQTAETRPGDVKYKDLDGNGAIEWDKDRTNIGSSIPSHYFGANISLAYKGFDFNMDLQGVAGSHIFNGWYIIRSGATLGNQDAVVLNRWRSEQNPGDGVQPRAVLGDPAGNTRTSSLMTEKINYLKIRQLSVGYTLPKLFVEKIGFNNIRVYCSANNLYTFTKYSQGYDPEIAGVNNNNLVRGIDGLYNIPRPRSVVFGVQFSL